MSDLAARLIPGLRAQEKARGYGIERAHVTTVGGAANWLWDYRDETGGRIWFGEGVREDIGRRLLWLRWLYRDRWAERGGRDG